MLVPSAPCATISAGASPAGTKSRLADDEHLICVPSFDAYDTRSTSTDAGSTATSGLAHRVGDALGLRRGRSLKHRRRIVEAGEREVRFGAILGDRQARQANARQPNRAARCARRVEDLDDVRGSHPVSDGDEPSRERDVLDHGVAPFRDDIPPFRRAWIRRAHRDDSPVRRALRRVQEQRVVNHAAGDASLLADRDRLGAERRAPPLRAEAKWPARGRSTPDPVG